MRKYLKLCLGSISVLSFGIVVIEIWFGTAACPVLGTAHLPSVALYCRLDSVLLPAAFSISQTAVDTGSHCCLLLPSGLFGFSVRRLHCAAANPPIGYLISWKAARSAEISVCAYQSTRCHVACDNSFLLNRHDVGSPEVHLGGKWWQAVFCFVIAHAYGSSSRQVAHCFLWEKNRQRCIH